MLFAPKLVGLQSSVGMIKLLFIIPAVNRNVLTLRNNELFTSAAFGHSIVIL